MNYFEKRTLKVLEKLPKEDKKQYKKLLKKEKRLNKKRNKLKKYIEKYELNDKKLGYIFCQKVALERKNNIHY